MLADFARRLAGEVGQPHRSRGAALLARQALESALDLHWRRRAPGLGECSMRTQLICLPEFSADPELAGRVSFVWWALSRVCHHHPSELPPSERELAELLDVVDDLVGTVV
ncbi:MAG: hypothetical protein RLN63_01870 [Miltoncostaeaceae bacterium]